MLVRASYRGQLFDIDAFFQLHSRSDLQNVNDVQDRATEISRYHRAAVSSDKDSASGIDIVQVFRSPGLVIVT
jgi:hypothetical protein